MGSVYRVSIAIVFILILSLVNPVIAYEDGKFNSSNGCSCHSSNSPATTPTHDFPTSYNASQSYSLSIGLSGGVSGSNGGFSLKVSQGTLSTGIGIGSVQINSAANQATHTVPYYRSWGLYWEAPSSGSGNVVFELAVLSANGNGLKTGDSWGIISPFTSTETTSNNTPPVATMLSFIPINPTKMTGLSINYSFSDSDGDPEQGTSIAWYLNGLRQNEIDDMTSLPNSHITKGDSWDVTVSPSDGLDYGENISLGPVTIGNSPPSITNLITSPENPDDSDGISISYDFSDIDGDTEQGTLIHWYLDGFRQDEIDNLTSISSLMIRSGDIWQVLIIPSDGQDEGQDFWSNQIIIGDSNTPPIIIVDLSTYDLYTNDDIQAIINFTDIDNDPIQDLEVKWFKNNTHIYSLDNLDIISSSITKKGEIWNYSARASDGLAWSSWVNSDYVVIKNTLPVASDATIYLDQKIITSDDIIATWTYYDTDQDIQSNSKITWFLNDISMSDYDGQKVVNSSFTSRGQSWSFQITPNDGENLGSTLRSPSVIISNAAPEYLEIYLKNGDEGWTGIIKNLSTNGDEIILSQNNLVARIGYYDVDDNILTHEIQWSRNGFHVPELDNMTYVLSERLAPGQIWDILVKISDPSGLSTTSSKSISISNNPPEPKIIMSPKIITPGAVITFDASNSFDLDGSINSWKWTVGETQINGETINLLLASGQYLVQLLVTDDMGSTNITQDTLTVDEILTVESFTGYVDDSDIILKWQWEGENTNFNIYRSTSPIEINEPLSSQILTPVGTTSDNEWSEKVPIGTILYYAITSIQNDEEVIWIDLNYGNTIIINASSSSDFVDSDIKDSSSLSIPLSTLLIIMGTSTIIFNISWRKRL